MVKHRPAWDFIRSKENPCKTSKSQWNIFVYECLEDDYFCQWFTFRPNERTTRSSELNKLQIPRIMNVHSEKELSYRGAVIWSSNPQEVIQNWYNALKIKYKLFLLDQQ